ncbi:MAG: Ig-like domain-containing protein, partial [Bryobacteraceae bacterium]|nr:Ig-like domain-containing protein [Bryobacteraceae bacterium]
MKCVAVFFLAPLAMFAQGPAASVQVVAPSLRAIAGEAVQFQAVVRDSAGTERNGDTIQWTVDAPAVATIQPATGMLTARSLGFVRVTAALGQMRNTLIFQVVPKRVVMTPSHADLTVGESQQFQATAYDVNDQPIPNLRYRWVAWSGTGGQTNIARVDANGMVRTSAVGKIEIHASFDYNANGAAPGFERQSQAAATLRVRAPQTYRLTRLIGTADMRGPFKLRARIVPVLGNDRGQIVFNAALDGLANGPLLIDGSSTQLLAYGGAPGPLPQTAITDFNEISFNNRGEVLTRVSVAFSGNVLYKLSRDGADPVFVDNTPLPGTEFLTGHFINRNSLNDDGAYLMRATYRVGNAGPTYTGLFRVPARGFPDEVVSNSRPLDGIAAGYSIDNDFGIAGSGLTYFTVTSQGRRFLYARVYDAPLKLLATGDSLLNSTVRSFSGNGFYMNNNGDLAVAVTLQNNEIYLLRYSGADLSAAPRTTRLRSFVNVFAVNPTAGVLFLGDAGRGYGAHLWSGGEPELVFQQNSAAFPLRGRPVQQIDYAAVSGSGEVTMLVRTPDYE